MQLFPAGTGARNSFFAGKRSAAALLPRPSTYDASSYAGRTATISNVCGLMTTI